MREMKRTTSKNIAPIILTSDWHLSDSAPLCRTDADWWETMTTKLLFIDALARSFNNCAVVHAGDLFDNWKPSPQLITFAMHYLPKRFFTIAGNHDIPQHNMDLFHKTGLATLNEGEYISFMENQCQWGTDPLTAKVKRYNLDGDSFVVAHVMTYPTGMKSWPNQTDPPAGKLLRKIDTPLIVTGHNHHGFVEEYKGKLLVNPGSIFRLTADQIDYKPRVYLWYAETNTVKPVYLPIEDNVSRDHLEIVQERDERIQQFIDRLQDTWEPKFSLEENLRAAFKENDTSKGVQKIIWKAVELDNG